MPQPISSTSERSARCKPHYVAATIYLIVAILGIAAAVQGAPVTLVVTVVAGLYSVYLYRGGRVVIWFW